MRGPGAGAAPWGRHLEGESLRLEHDAIALNRRRDGGARLPTPDFGTAGARGAGPSGDQGTDVVRRGPGERIESLSFRGAVPAAGEPVFEAPGALPPSGIALASYRQSAACYLPDKGKTVPCSAPVIAPDPGAQFFRVIHCNQPHFLPKSAAKGARFPLFSAC